MMAGVDMVHVPYRGTGPSLTNLIGGQVQVTFEATPASIGYIRAGTLRALVTTTRRSEALPDIPTVAEFVPGCEASAWFGVGAPKATPAEIVEKLNSGLNTITWSVHSRRADPIKRSTRPFCLKTPRRKRSIC
jgi:tripartite-type tricarboxylate transporter receptor subunit TctC